MSTSLFFLNSNGNSETGASHILFDLLSYCVIFPTYKDMKAVHLTSDANRFVQDSPKANLIIITLKEEISGVQVSDNSINL
jgi:hypothetical protein